MTNEYQVASTNVNHVKLKPKLSFAEILAIVLICGQIVLYSFMWFRLLKDPSLKTMDFIGFYAVGRIAGQGNYQLLFDLDTQRAVQQIIVPEFYSGRVNFNQHPPYLAPLLSLLAVDDFVHSYILWTLVRLVVLAICGELIRGFLLHSGLNPLAALLVTLSSLCFFPFFIGLLGGQDTVFIMFGLFLWMFGLLEAREIRAGVGLALASLSPLIAVALGFPLLITRRKASVWFILAIFVLMLYSLALIGIQGGKDFVGLMRLSSQGGDYGLNQFAMYNLLGLLIRTFPSLSIDKVHSIIWIAYAVFILAMCVLWWNKRDYLTIKHISIAVVLGTFTSPHLHLHGLSFLLLPLLGMVVILHDRGNTSFALILIPAVSSLLVIIMFLIPAWNFAAYYLLMLAMLLGFIMLKPPVMLHKNLSV